jgi:TPR repeat protein
LDEKAIEAVKKWRFRPGYKDGKPVTVASTIEVNFRLLDWDYEQGLKYYRGDGGKTNYGKAVKSFRVAAKHRNADAQRMLGRMYEEGEGVRRDYVLAYMWLDLSATGGNRQAREARDKLAQKMSPDQIAKGQRLAREWK